MDETQYTIQYYVTGKGYSPFIDWLSSLDPTTRRRIQARIARMSNNLGDYTPIQGVDGLFEARIFHGPGYRLYFSIEGKRIVLFFAGGDKKTQKKDIQKASAMLEEHRRE
ncbi:MAG: type II toxin-antitoxin system RelE/ParE family toxin [Deltaproteobacteria bacterium]|nr:type II toxin-antitoxin system RelE/ParE family toxin [Deltaproteobacteria bacterium]